MSPKQEELDLQKLMKALLESLPKGYPQKPPLNFLKVASVESAEKIYSKLLAELLKSDCGTELINGILKHLEIEHPLIPSNSKPKVETERLIPKSNRNPVKEKSYIDIHIRFTDTAKPLLIAIENKINADERDNQIEKYQQALKSEYKGYQCIIIFLTPSGRPSTTANKKLNIKCHSLSYSALADVLEALKTKGDTEAYITTFIHSIKENVTMKTNEKSQAYKIWGNMENRKILNELCKHIPRLEDIRKGLTDKIAEFLKEENDELVKNTDNKLSWYEESIDYVCSYTAISFQTKHFKKNQLYFVFYDCLGNYDELNETLSMRVLIWGKPSAGLKKRLKEYYDFDPVKSNYDDQWYALKTEWAQKPQYQVEEDHDYDKKLIRLFFDAFKKEYTKLRKRCGKQEV